MITQGKLFPWANEVNPKKKKNRKRMSKLE